MEINESLAASMIPDQQVETMSLDVTYNASLTSDIAAFEQSLSKALETVAIEPGAEVARAMFEPLEFINSEATQLMEYAQTAAESGGELSPSEIVTLTVKSQEFMFHSQLTANVANRTADGIQQLFRQQS